MQINKRLGFIKTTYFLLLSNGNEIFEKKKMIFSTFFVIFFLFYDFLYVFVQHYLIFKFFSEFFWQSQVIWEKCILTGETIFFLYSFLIFSLDFQWFFSYILVIFMWFSMLRFFSSFSFYSFQDAFFPNEEERPHFTLFFFEKRRRFYYFFLHFISHMLEFF